MSNLIITGKPVRASRLKGVLFSIANTIARQKSVIGSLEQTEDGARCQFIIGNDVIGLSIMTIREGGTL